MNKPIFIPASLANGTAEVVLVNQTCAATKNPMDGQTSWDNFFWGLHTWYKVIIMEGWADIMYALWHTWGNPPLVSAIFVCVLFIGRFFIMQLCIAAVKESYEVAEEEVEAEARKRLEEHSAAARVAAAAAALNDGPPTLSLHSHAVDGEKGAAVETEGGRQQQQQPEGQPTTKDGEAPEVVGRHRGHGNGGAPSAHAGEKGKEEEEVEGDDDVRHCCCACWKRLPWCLPQSLRQPLKALTAHWAFKSFFFAAVVANAICMAMDSYVHGQPDVPGLEAANAAFVVIFDVEMILKVAALGFAGYTAKKFNIFDAAIALLSSLDLALLASGAFSGSFGRVMLGFRGLRALRLAKIARSTPALRRMAGALIDSLFKASAALALLLGVVFIFGVLGMHAFGGTYEAAVAAHKIHDVPRGNYNNIWMGFITTFTVLAGESFNETLDVTMASGGSIAGSLFFFAVCMIGNYVILNVVLVIIIESIEEADEHAKQQARQHGSSSHGHGGGGHQQQIEEAIIEGGDARHGGAVAPAVFIENGGVAAVATAVIAATSDAAAAGALHSSAAPKRPPPHSFLIRHHYTTWLQWLANVARCGKERTCAPIAEVVRLHAALSPGTLVAQIAPTVQSVAASLALFASERTTDERASATSSSSHSRRKAPVGGVRITIVPARSWFGYGERTLTGAAAGYLVDIPGGGDVPADAMRRSLTPALQRAAAPSLRIVQVASGVKAAWIDTIGGQGGSSFAGFADKALTRPTDEVAEIEEDLVREGGASKKALPSRGGGGGCCRAPKTLTHHYSLYAQLRASDHASCCLFRHDNWLRIWVTKVLTSHIFEVLVFCAIALSCVSLAFEGPTTTACIANGSCPGLSTFMSASKLTVVIFFSVELALRALSQGIFFHEVALFRGVWGWLDALVVAFAIADYFLVSKSVVSVLRSLRAFRSLRSLRIISWLPGTRTLIESLFRSAPRLLKTGVLVLGCLSAAALFAQQLFRGALYKCNDPSVTAPEACVGTFALQGPLPCALLPTEAAAAACAASAAGALFPRRWEPLSRNYDTFGRALSTTFELMTTVDWPSRMWEGMDAVGTGKAMVREGNMAASLFFIIVVCLTHYILLDLFIVVLINTYKESHELDTGAQFQNEEQVLWSKIMQVVIAAKPIRRQRVEAVGGKELFGDARESSNAAAGGGGGARACCSSRSCCCCCCRCGGGGWFLRAARRLLFAIATSGLFDKFIFACITANAILLAAQYDGESAASIAARTRINDAFAVLFMLEALIKLVGLGAGQYFRSAWNCFDFAVSLACIASTGVALHYEATGRVLSGAGIATLVRLLRLLRLLGLLRAAPKLRHLVMTLLRVVPAILSAVVALGVLIFIFAVIGVALFSDVKLGTAFNGLNADANFRSFGLAYMTLFRFATGENWNLVAVGLSVQPPYCEEGVNCGNPTAAYLFATLFETFSAFLMLHLLVGVILAAFDAASPRKSVKEAKALKQGVVFPTEAAVEDFRAAWEASDPEGRGLIHAAEQLPALVARIARGAGPLRPHNWRRAIHDDNNVEAEAEGGAAAAAYAKRLEVASNAKGQVAFHAVFAALLVQAAHGRAFGSTVESIATASADGDGKHSSAGAATAAAATTTPTADGGEATAAATVVVGGGISGGLAPAPAPASGAVPQGGGGPALAPAVPI